MTSPSASSPFVVRELFPGVWGIADMGVNCYLIAGATRAALIDTGWGFGDLAALVASLTPLPVTVINTHGHPDHVCGDFQFAEVYIGVADLASPFFDSAEIRGKMLERISGRGPLPDFDHDAWLHAPTPRRIPLAPDDAFDLGGRTLKIIPTPGHTPGSLCVLDVEARLLCTGDTIVDTPILMLLPEGLTLRAYSDSLHTLMTVPYDIEALLPGHGNPPLAPARIADLQSLCYAILDGVVTGEPTQTMLGAGLCAKAETCSICYNPDKLK